MENNDNVEVTAEQIEQLLSEGKSKTDIGNQFGISAQKVGMILAAAKKEELEESDKPTGKDLVDPKASEPKTEIVKDVPASAFAETYNASDVTKHSKIAILTPEEYKKYSEANGRVMGRRKDQKTKCSIEELRALINSGYKPSRIIDKHGMDSEEFKQLVWSLSQKELRARPLKYSLDQDFIEKG